MELENLKISSFVIEKTEIAAMQIKGGVVETGCLSGCGHKFCGPSITIVAPELNG